MDYEKIGKRIKKYREAAEMTQENLGEASHYSPQHISKVENAQTNADCRAKRTPVPYSADSLRHN